MHRLMKIVILILAVVMSLHQVTFAATSTQPSKPTVGIESSDPNHGSSSNSGGVTTESIGLITGYGCTIDNKVDSLFLTGTTTASYIVETVSVTLYLQQWDGMNWMDVKSFTYSDYDTMSITNGDYVYSFEPGNYYRTRAVHYAKDGLETDTKYSESSYIYIS